jgi:hypothetical protein
MKNPAFSQKTTTLPKKLPEFNIVKLGGHQLTFGLLDVFFKGQGQYSHHLLIKKPAFSQKTTTLHQLNYLNSTFSNLEVNS